MDALSPGDEILAATASGTVTTGYISVFSIAKPNAANVAHVHLTTDSNATLTLTPAHHVPVGSACCSDLKTAGSIAPGDVVWLLHGGATAASAQRVVSTDLAIGDKLGLYSPVLTNGAFPIVDGFVTSFDAIAPVRLASYLLAPFEAMCVATGTCDAFRRAFFGAAGVADGKIVGGAAAAAAVFMPLSAAA